MVNYDNSLIYTIKTDNGVYVGSTSNLKERRYCHSKSVYNEAAKSYNLNVRKAFSSAEDKREYSMKKNVIKTVCECGCVATLGHIARHRKTKKHIKLMKAKISPEKFLKYVEIKD